MEVVKPAKAVWNIQKGLDLNVLEGIVVFLDSIERQLKVYIEIQDGETKGLYWEYSGDTAPPVSIRVGDYLRGFYKYPQGSRKDMLEAYELLNESRDGVVERNLRNPLTYKWIE